MELFFIFFLIYKKEKKNHENVFSHLEKEYRSTLKKDYLPFYTRIENWKSSPNLGCSALEFNKQQNCFTFFTVVVVLIFLFFRFYNQVRDQMYSAMHNILFGNRITSKIARH